MGALLHVKVCMYDISQTITVKTAVRFAILYEYGPYG